MQMCFALNRPYPVRRRVVTFFGELLWSIGKLERMSPLVAVAYDGLDKRGTDSRVNPLPKRLQVKYALRIRKAGLADMAARLLEHRTYVSMAQNILSETILRHGDAMDARTVLIKERRPQLHDYTPCYVTSPIAERNLAKVIDERGDVRLACLVLMVRNLQDPEAQKILARKIQREGEIKDVHLLLSELETSLNPSLEFLSRNAPVCEEAIDMLKVKANGIAH